jgi:hypothetical protein
MAFAPDGKNCRAAGQELPPVALENDRGCQWDTPQNPKFLCIFCLRDLRETF